MKKLMIFCFVAWLSILTLSAQSDTACVSRLCPDSLRPVPSHADPSSEASLNMLVVSYSPGDFRGVQFGAFFNTLGGEMRGLQLSSVLNGAKALRGVQLAAFSNISAKPFRGVQLSGVSNISMGVRSGLQWAGVINVASGMVNGVQAASYNYADTLHGWQVGLINVATSHRHGWQVGIFNYTRDTVAHKLGLLNVNPATVIDFMGYVGTSSKSNFAIRFRNRSTYNIIGVGTHYMGLDRRFSGALFYRIGQYVALGPHSDARQKGLFTLGGDVGFYHIETFQHHSSSSPERLFSLQARLNADYQLSRQMGLTASLGYGDTRHYHHGRHYRQRPLIEAGLTWRLATPPDRAPSATFLPADSMRPARLSTPVVISASDGFVSSCPARWGIAAAEVTGINALVHSFDRFVMNEDFAQVNLHTIHRNFKKGFVWDNDQFSTNLFAHPYHGNLYFNAARSNGLNFWQSAPYALGGSLMWELFGEIEPPAINDLMATTFGGICIGEITHRISDLILRGGKGRRPRFWRRAAALVVDPMKGLNRLIYPSCRPETAPSATQPRTDFSFSVGNRYLADNGALFRGEHNPYVNLYLEYGDALNEDEQTAPYDFFDFEVTFGLSSNQPVLNGLHLLGRLWSTPVMTGNAISAEFGFYQHFNYFDSKPVRDGSDLTPYRISEAAALGPGLVLEFQQVGSLEKLQQRVFMSGILLGGTKSDYYNVIDRDYNMGSGYSIKSKTHMEFRRVGRFILHAQYYQLFTWKGYEQKDLATINPLYLNAQGDRGRAALFVLNPIMEIDLGRQLSIVAAASYYSRNTHYRYYDHVRAQTYQFRIGLTCHL